MVLRLSRSRAPTKRYVRALYTRLRSDVYPDVFVSISQHKLQTLSRLSALHGKASL